MNDNLIWYACYGSNLNSERFRCYIAGGQYRGKGRYLDPCEDPTLWRDSRFIRVPGRMHFAKEISSWGEGGVAFYRPESEGTVIMRLYLITREQFRHVQKKEGRGADWYGLKVPLGEMDGIPVMTLTSVNRVFPENRPCEDYLNTIRDALINECGMTVDETERYLEECLSPLQD